MDRRKSILAFLFAVVTLIWVISVYAGSHTPSAEDCPALAASQLKNPEQNILVQCDTNPRSVWQPVCSALRNKSNKYKYYPAGVYGSDYAYFWRDVAGAGKGTSYCHLLLKTQKEFENKLLQCGGNTSCALQVIVDRNRQLNGFREKFTGPELTRGVFMAFLGPDGSLPVGDGETLEQRAIRGLSISPLPKAILSQGVLYWGIEPHNAQTQSLVFSDDQGKVQALGLVDKLYYRYPDGKQTHLDANAGIRLFVRDPAVLPTLLPVVRAWAAADLLGLNQSCSDGQVAQCKAAQKVVVPITAYRLPCTGGKLAACRLPLPKGRGKAPSLNQFWQ